MARNLINIDGTCPHCLRAVTFRHARAYASGNAAKMTEAEVHFADAKDQRVLLIAACPSCTQATVQMATVIQKQRAAGGPVDMYVNPVCLWPKFRSVPNVTQHAPSEIANDLLEAHRTIDVSPKASAALSRRVMQAILHRNGFKAKNLDAEIDLAIAAHLPTYVADVLHAVRRIGNFSAHAKADVTGEILDATEEEAKWCIQVVEDLIDHFYVRKAEAAARIAALDAKDPKTKK